MGNPWLSLAISDSFFSFFFFPGRVIKKSDSLLSKHYNRSINNFLVEAHLQNSDQTKTGLKGNMPHKYDIRLKDEFYIIDLAARIFLLKI